MKSPFTGGPVIRQVHDCDVLDGKSKKKLVKNAEKNFEEKAFRNFLFRNTEPSEITGYRVPSFDRLAAMVSYFAVDLEPFSTKLNKLLFYADFNHFNIHGESISGASYQTIQMGPVPHRYGSL